MSPPKVKKGKGKGGKGVSDQNPKKRKLGEKSDENVDNSSSSTTTSSTSSTTPTRSSSGNDTNVQELCHQVEHLEGKVFDYEVLIEQLEKRCTFLEQANTDLVLKYGEERYKSQVLANENNENQQYMRRNNILIFNIRDTNKYEDHLQTEKIVIDFLSSKLGLRFGPGDFDICHRLGKFSPDANRAIVCKFIYRKAKIAVLENRKKLKGSNISIAEHLTPKNVKRLHDIHHLPCVSQSWSRDGRLFAKNQDNIVKEIKFQDVLSEKLFDPRPTPQPPKNKDNTPQQDSAAQASAAASGTSGASAPPHSSTKNAPSDSSVKNTKQHDKQNTGQRGTSGGPKKDNITNSDNITNGNNDNPPKASKSKSFDQKVRVDQSPPAVSSGDAPALGNSSVTSDLVSAMDTDAGPKPVQSSTPKRSAIDKLLEMAQGQMVQGT